MTAEPTRAAPLTPHPERLAPEHPHYAEIIAGDDWLKTAKTPDQVRDALTNYPRRESIVEQVAKRKLTG